MMTTAMGTGVVDTKNSMIQKDDLEDSFLS